MASTDPTLPTGQPLFLLSFGARDALAEAAARCGWRAVAARRRDLIERRFLASGACVALIDLRGALASGLEALQRLAPTAEAEHAVLLVLIDAGDKPRLGDVLAAGASFYLAAPFDELELSQALGFARRLAERLGGDATGRTAALAAEAEGWRWRPSTDRTRLSPALAQRLGIEGDAAALRPMLRLLGHDGRRSARDAVLRLMETGRHAAFAHGTAEGERLVHHLGLDEATGEVTGWIETLEGATPPPPRLVQRDPLTGLAGPAAAAAWVAARLAGGGGCVLLRLSIRRFDMINAAFGRVAGDALLQGVARRIERLTGPLRRERLVARLSGADYLIGLAAPAGAEEAEFLAARLAETIAQPFLVQDQLANLSCRIGIAVAEPDERDADALIARAAAALAEASAGEGSVSLMGAAETRAAERDSQLEVDLRRALDAGEIGILYQPQVDVITGRIVGVEALARWRHPRLGALGAAELFAAAARSDYLLELSAHVQRLAAEEAAGWPARLADCRLSINVTPADMAQPGFAGHFAEMIDTAGLARTRVTVEVTETSLIEDLGQAAALLATLREQGFRTALDDFGTGYSSLAYLKALPLDYLKIDKRLSDDIVGSPRDRVVVRSVIDMARALGLTVIAEGVETEAQLALLAAEGCTLYQGFLCAPPLGTAALARLVARAERA